MHPHLELAEFLTTQAISVEEYDGVIEESVSYEKDLNVAIFYAEEVNEGAIFLPIRAFVIVISLSFLPGKRLSCRLSFDCLIFQVVLKSFVLLLQRKNYVQNFLLLVSSLETMIQVEA